MQNGSFRDPIKLPYSGKKELYVNTALSSNQSGETLDEEGYARHDHHESKSNFYRQNQKKGDSTKTLK